MIAVGDPVSCVAMTVDEAQAALEAAGLQLQSKERTGNNDGWCLKFTTIGRHRKLTP